LPLSRKAGETLLAASVRRLGDVVPPARTWVVTADQLLPDVAAALPDVPPELLIGEPVGRNTAAALGLAAVHAAARDGEAVLACLPADQHVGVRVFRHAFELAEQRDVIVTVGLAPTRAETGYGYLELGEALGGGAFHVARFVEKPDKARAEEYVASKRYLWNGGMFFLRARRLLAEIRAHLPALADGLDEIDRALRRGGPVAALAATSQVYPTLPSVSIDHGVMEKASGILTVAGDFGWNDVGAWSALADVLPGDGDGNHARAQLVAHDAKNNLVVADPGVVVSLVGVSDLVVVQAGDAVLVLPRERAQDVKEITRLLAERGLSRYL
jgi:mannose-1-phosphate guanylyltransferase